MICRFQKCCKVNYFRHFDNGPISQNSRKILPPCTLRTKRPFSKNSTLHSPLSTLTPPVPCPLKVICFRHFDNGPISQNSRKILPPCTLRTKRPFSKNSTLHSPLSTLTPPVPCPLKVICFRHFDNGPISQNSRKILPPCTLRTKRPFSKNSTLHSPLSTLTPPVPCPLKVICFRHFDNGPISQNSRKILPPCILRTKRPFSKNSTLHSPHSTLTPGPRPLNC